jgi:hypothetical protein
MTPSGFSGVYPPYGKYHTQFLVYARTPEQLQPFDGVKLAELPSEEYCLQPSSWPDGVDFFSGIGKLPSCWPSGPM